MWDFDALAPAPRTYPAPHLQHLAPDLTPLFFDGCPYRGRDTRVFAWLGVPEGPADVRLPAMVLVHGGGGTAFAEWVRLWNRRGYAAIAMDTCGCVPFGQYSNWQRHEHAGPPGWGDFDGIDAPETDQWTYHAVAAVVRAHSLLRAQPQIDPARIGITGISWGGYLTCIVAGVDSRLKFAATVYGCGRLGENSAWLENLHALGPDRARRWLNLWDPAVYLPQARLPMLWVTGTNDFAYPLDSVQKSYRLPTGPRTLCVTLRMEHGHGGPGENPPEIHAFANHHLQDAPPLPRIIDQQLDGARLTLRYESHPDRPVTGARLCYSRACWQWNERPLPAFTTGDSAAVTVEAPPDVEACYLNLTTADKLTVSSEHLTLDKKT